MIQEVQRLAKLLEGIASLPPELLERYPAFQFDVGWRRRNKLAARPVGPIASHEMHPDAEKAYSGLDPSVQSFVRWMSMHHFMLFAALNSRVAGDGSSALVALRQCGADPDLKVPEDLMAQVNAAHHEAWLAARATFSFLGIGAVRDHSAGKERSHLTPDEVKADNAQVQAYALILSQLTDEDFARLQSLTY